ncbi:hypothetical protein [Halorussus ruber]|uniref:hypothetical protein n=1 Tax=Halorussus ruber TaxID=1126238 RepID=UPI001091BE0A|nr:hypothetical protein [Halorussus ruber]
MSVTPEGIGFSRESAVAAGRREKYRSTQTTVYLFIKYYNRDIPLPNDDSSGDLVGEKLGVFRMGIGLGYLVAIGAAVSTTGE